MTYRNEQRTVFESKGSKPKGFKLGGALMMLFWALLIINPAYAQQIDQVLSEEPSTGRVKANRVAVDSLGNRYVFGQINGTVNFGPGESGMTIEGTDDVYIAKYNKDGVIQWVREFESLADNGGGIPGASAVGIDVDEANNALYVTGTFLNTLDVDFVRLVSTDASADVYVARMNMATGNLDWANQIKGTQVIGVSALDTKGNLVITGRFNGIAEFIGQFNTSKTILAKTPGGSDMYAAVYSPVGQLSFVRQAGSTVTTGSRGAEGIGVQFNSGAGSFTVVGEFHGPVRFEDATAPVQLTSLGSADGFVAHYNSSGQLRYVKQIGSANSEGVSLVVHNTQGSKTYVSGVFRGTLTIGTTALTSLGDFDRFLVRYDTLSGNVEHVSQVGSSSIDFTQALATDELNNVYMTGRFAGPQLTIGTGATAIQLAANGHTAYIAGMNAELVPIFGQTIQGKLDANFLVAEPNGNLHLAGSYGDAIVFGSGTQTQTISLPNPTGDEALVVARYRPDPLPPFDPTMLYISTASGGTVNGIAFQDEDIIAFDPADNSWSLLIDGSDLGLGGTDIDAFEWLSDQSVLMSFNTTVNVAGVGLVGDEDLVRFVPRLLGATTAGNFERFLIGNAVGLDMTNEDEDIDAVTVTPQGLVISTQGPASVPGVNGVLSAGESDLLVFDRRNSRWSIFMEGADLGLTLSSEDINALSLANNGLHLGTLGAFSINGSNSQGQPFSVSGDASDVVTCIPESLGAETRMESCALSFDGSANGLSGLDVDAIAGGRNTTQGTDFSDDPGVPEPADGADDVIVEETRLVLPLIVR